MGLELVFPLGLGLVFPLGLGLGLGLGYFSVSDLDQFCVRLFTTTDK